MKALKHLNKYFFKYRYRLILGMLCVVVSNIFSAIPAKAVSNAIDLLSARFMLINSNTKVNISDEEFEVNLLKLVALIVVFALLRGLFMYLMRQCIIVMSRLIEFDLKNEVFNHYQLLSASFYKKNNTGDLMARISEDVSRVRMYIGPAIMYFTNLIATFVIVIPIMFAVNSKLALFVLLPLPVLSFAIFKVHNIINKKSDAIQAQMSVITSTAQEVFSGIRVIKAFGAEQYFRKLFVNQSEIYRNKNMDMAKVDATFFPLMVFLTGLSTIITIFYGGILVINGQITLGNIAEFVIYVNLLTWPVASLGFTTALVQRAAASQLRLNEFLQTQPEINQQDGLNFCFNNEIVFKNVSYTYADKTIPALQHINLSIKKGTTLAILGTTGSGKTTLVQLLLRMFDVTDGEILIDGVNVKQLSLQQFKNTVGYVPQDVFLFSDTVANNISFGLKSPQTQTQQLVEQASIKAALHNNVLDFKEGYETIVGERGITLSGGQKQRVSIARALIANPSLYIFDDCLSAVDTKTEAEILANLQETIQNNTTILVSHRVSTVKNANQIIMLDEGKIVEAGNHEQLMQLNLRYATLYHNQMIAEQAQ